MTNSGLLPTKWSRVIHRWGAGEGTSAVYRNISSFPVVVSRFEFNSAFNSVNSNHVVRFFLAVGE